MLVRDIQAPMATTNDNQKNGWLYRRTCWSLASPRHQQSIGTHLVFFHTTLLASFPFRTKHLMLLETIKTFQARYPSPVKTRENGKMIDLSILSCVSTGGVYGPSGTRVIPHTFKGFWKWTYGLTPSKGRQNLESVRLTLQEKQYFTSVLMSSPLGAHA